MPKNTNVIRRVDNEQVKKQSIRPHIKKVQQTQAVSKSKLIKVSACMFYVVALCIILIYGKVQLTDINHELQELKTEYTEVESERTRLDTELSSLVSLKSVEQRAKELGLTEVKQSQIDYIVVSENNTVEVAEESTSFMDKLTEWYHQIKEYILG